ncbi:MAG: hypothetical protein JJT90_03475 [Ectothiorhodospiraceae bacterium]|nr:hypothetical protein [Ectothiorhodospiraceae bacterium]
MEKEDFRRKSISLSSNYSVSVGVAAEKKSRQFDPGSDQPEVLVQCKSHRWTTGGNVPSAKITAWNEAMYYFHLALPQFRKVLFVLRDFSEKRGETLAAYYARNFGHLVPSDVEILEYDEVSGEVRSVLSRALLGTGFSADEW